MARTTAAAQPQRTSLKRNCPSEQGDLKGTWRIIDDLALIVKESEIYAEKLDADEVLVSSIPTDLASGLKHYPRAQFHPHQHCYRLIVRQVERDLKLFETTWEVVVNAMADVLMIKANKVAYKKAHILHGDISVGITNDGKGLLIDWDLCKVVNESNSLRDEYTGAWQFMASRIQTSNHFRPPYEIDETSKLEEPLQHVLADDLESFYHVLCWMALLYTPTPGYRKIYVPDRDLVSYRGGRFKSLHFLDQSMKRNARLADGVLKDLINDLESVCRVRYISPPTAGDRDDYEMTKERAKTSEWDKQRLKREVAYIYDSDMEKLLTSDWMLERFRAAAKCRDQLQAN